MKIFSKPRLWTWHLPRDSLMSLTPHSSLRSRRERSEMIREGRIGGRSGTTIQGTAHPQGPGPASQVGHQLGVLRLASVCRYGLPSERDGDMRLDSSSLDESTRPTTRPCYPKSRLYTKNSVIFGSFTAQALNNIESQEKKTKQHNKQTKKANKLTAISFHPFYIKETVLNSC